MYLAGVSVRRVEDISEALLGSRVSASTISELNQKAYVHIKEWRNRPLSSKYPYVYVYGIYLKRNWGGEFENVSILVAIGVDNDGYREDIGVAEGMKVDKESWKNFQTNISAVQCVFYRNAFSAVPRNRLREVTRMLKAIHAQESK